VAQVPPTCSCPRLGILDHRFGGPKVARIAGRCACRPALPLSHAGATRRLMALRSWRGLAYRLVLSNTNVERAERETYD
jgi:hypothetical protein